MVGRPVRSKISYNNEIQRLKRDLKKMEDRKDALLDDVLHLNKRMFPYLFPTIKQRIKFLIKGEI